MGRDGVEVLPARGEEKKREREREKKREKRKRDFFRVWPQRNFIPFGPIALSRLNAQASVHVLFLPPVPCACTRTMQRPSFDACTRLQRTPYAVHRTPYTVHVGPPDTRGTEGW